MDYWKQIHTKITNVAHRNRKENKKEGHVRCFCGGEGIPTSFVNLWRKLGPLNFVAIPISSQCISIFLQNSLTSLNVYLVQPKVEDKLQFIYSLFNCQMTFLNQNEEMAVILSQIL